MSIKYGVVINGTPMKEPLPMKPIKNKFLIDGKVVIGKIGGGMKYTPSVIVDEPKQVKRVPVRTRKGKTIWKEL